MEIQKKERQMPALTQYGTSEEAKFFSALHAKKIRELPETALREALRYSMTKIGLRGANFPKGIEKSLLLQHIWENFGELSPEEIKLAFDWAIDDRLDIDEYNCYENFSCAYVSKILKAYISKRNQVFKAPKIEEKKVLQIEQPITEEFKESDFAKKLEKLGIKIPE